MLSSIWPDPGSRINRLWGVRHVLHGFERLVTSLHHAYDDALAWSLKHRLWVMLIAFATFAASFALVPLIGSEFVSKEDQSEFGVRLEMPVGTSLEAMRAKTEQVETSLRAIPELKQLYSRVGSGNGNNTGFVTVVLKPRAERTRKQDDIEREARQAVARVAGLTASVGNDKPIQVALLGQDWPSLKRAATELERRIAAIPGVTDLSSSDKDAVPALSVRPKRDQANDLGVNVAQMGSALRVFVAGDAVATWLAPTGENIDVRVRLAESQRTDRDAIGQLPLSAGVNADGSTRLVSLSQVADVVESTSPKIIERMNLQRQIVLSAAVQGRSVGEVNTEVRKLTEATALPPGVRFDYQGTAQIMQESFGFAVLALGMSVVFIYFVLGSQFGSFLQPIAIMLSLPLSLIGVLLALLVTRSTVNLLSIIGFIMLMGLVTKNAILLVDFANQARKRGASIMEALREAGQVRLRPILMTTAAMIFGMLPMALGREEGSDGSMGRAIIGGIITSTLLTLIVVPVAYSLIEGAKGRWARRKLREAPDSSADVPTAPLEHAKIGG